jgi:hypothetical protein
MTLVKSLPLIFSVSFSSHSPFTTANNNSSFPYGSPLSSLVSINNLCNMYSNLSLLLPPPPLQKKALYNQYMYMYFFFVHLHSTPCTPIIPSFLHLFSPLRPSSNHPCTVSGTMLSHPRQVCPRPKILGCCTPLTKRPLAIVSLTEPSHP